MTKELLNEPVDVIEDKIYNLSPSLLKLLLKDHSTKENLRWATSTYEKHGEWYRPEREIKVEQLIGPNINLLSPRVSKTAEEQQARTKDKGEVFTPAWMCNKQVNFLDEDWFGRKNVFNIEIENGWKTNKRKITFSKKLVKTWQDYVSDIRMEITCGEAPYLVSRYDVVKGEIIPVNDRIGILDRKLRVVNENVNDLEEWLEWALNAYKSTYGYDYQGDNVLIARENLLYTFIDNYMVKFSEQPNLIELKKFANVISWNVWQMDGLQYTVPYSDKVVEDAQISLFNFGDEPQIKEPVHAIIKNWSNNKTLKMKDLAGGKNNMKKFGYIIGNPPYQKLDGGAQASATPVYQYFSREASKISSVSCLIEPSRWMTGGKGLDDYRREMLNNRHIKALHDFGDSSAIFKGVDIKGGVCIYNGQRF